MKKSQLQSLIREEIKKTLTEAQFLPIYPGDSNDVKKATKMVNTTLKNLQSIYKIGNQDIEALVVAIDDLLEATDKSFKAASLQIP